MRSRYDDNSIWCILVQGIRSVLDTGDGYSPHRVLSKMVIETA